MEGLSSSKQDFQVRKPRRRKVRISNLSARLNPDFDPKHVTEVASNNNKEFVNFDVIAKHLPPAFIHKYLHEVLQFLRSDEKELCFPVFPLYEEEFLVKIAQNNDYLKSNLLDEESSRIGTHILDVLEKFKNVYKWVYGYEDRGLDTITIVYKKLSVEKAQENQREVLCSPSTIPFRLAANIKDMSLLDRQAISPSFKTKMLNTTLKFIKDPTRLIVEYPEMSLPEGQFLFNLIYHPDQKDGNLGLGFKSMYSSLYETLEGLKEKYEFHLYSKHTSDVTIIRISLKKIPKTKEVQIKKDTNSSIDLNSSISNSTGSASDRALKVQREFLFKQNIINGLTEDFLHSSMSQVIGFIEDQFMASLEFKNVNVVSSRFLERLVSFSRTEEYYQLFSPECEVLLKRICRASRRDWMLRVCLGKLCRRTGTRTIVFYKTPAYKTKNVAQNAPVQCKKINALSNSEKLANALDTSSKNEGCLVKMQSSDNNEGTGREVSLRSMDGDEKCNSKERRSDSVERRDYSKDRRSDWRSDSVERRVYSKDRRSDSKDWRSDSVERRVYSKDRRSASKDWRSDSVKRREYSKDRRSDSKDGRSDSVERREYIKDRRSDSKDWRSDCVERRDYSKDRRSDSKDWRSDSVERREYSKYRRSDSKDWRSDCVERRDYSKDRRSDSKGCRSDSKERKSDSKDRKSDSKERRAGIKVLRTDSQERSSKTKSIRAIPFQSAGLVASEGTAGDDTAAAQRLLPASRNARLLKAFNTPLESELAERMMRGMGWEGGALGARGDGIVEPIIPALHIAPGAGLGHVQQPQPSPAEFRARLLRALLALLQSAARETALALPAAITKREGRFVSPMITAFNNRVPLGLHAPEEVKLVKAILDYMMGDLRLQIEFQISDDKRELRLARVTGPMFTPKEKKKHVPPSKQTNSSDVTADSDVISVTSLTDELDSICPTRKAAKKLAYKIKFLEIMIEFLTNENEELEYKFDCVLCKTQKMYILRVVKDVNKGMVNKQYSELEIELCKKIGKLAIGCYVTATTDKKTLKLSKKFSSNRTTNCPQSLSPPKSKDLKNTIIYKNNVAIPAEKYNEHCATKNDSKTTNDDISNHDNETPDKCHQKIAALVTKVDEENDGVSNYDHDIANRDEDYVKNHQKIANVDSDVTNIGENNGHGDDTSFKTKDKNDVTHDTGKVLKSDYFEEKDLDDNISLYANNDSLILDMVDKEYENVSTEYDSIELNLSEVKNDHDIKVKHEGSPTDNINFEYGSNSTPTKRICSTTEQEPSKKIKFVKYVTIRAQDGKEIGIDSVKLVQKLLSDVIDEKVFLPLLKCHGVQDGGLLYSCHSEDSYDWLINVMNVATGVKIIETDFYDVFNLGLKVTSFIEEKAETVFNRLEMYNSGLNTNMWTILDKQMNGNIIQFNVKVDEKSFRYISDNNFSLYAGIDKAQFYIL